MDEITKIRTVRDLWEFAKKNKAQDAVISIASDTGSIDYDIYPNIIYQDTKPIEIVL